MSPRFVVGIDLGTTNTVVAAGPRDGSPADARVFPVPQLVTAGEVEALPLFPSALYAPAEGERVIDPFGDAPWVLGELARRRGVEVPGRLVASGKSWLGYAAVDRTAAVLPWGGAVDAPKLSPVDAASRLLAHVRAAWDAQNPGAPLSAQDVVLAVPASFDEVARELTVEAASRVGLAPRLVEEPQAAFYDWMARAGRAGLARLTGASAGASAGACVVLVVDVGGGTTDLSLVRVAGPTQVERVAVGPHVLLGGDNMDLALAHRCEPALVEPGSKLDAVSFAQLVAACRAAKEALLGHAPPDDAPVTVLGRGAGLVGAARATRLTRADVEQVVLDGFLPLVPADARPVRARGALQSFGLPYERDVAITRHVANFVATHLGPGGAPDALLLNGGVFRAARAADRVAEALANWRGGRPVARLTDADPDLAVARGAVAYGLARLGRGVRIGGGSARSYFVGVAPAERAGGAGAAEGRTRAVCVVPRGAEEGAVHGAPGRAFGLVAGRPVRFDLYASDASEARPGDVVEIDEDSFTKLPPLAASIDAHGGGEVRVTVEGELTAVGTLDLSCVETGAEAPRRFRLAFQLRGGSAPPGERSSAPTPSAAAPARRLEAALDRLDRAFGKPRADASGREAKDLLYDLERCLSERSQWTTAVNRALFDALLRDARARRRSPDHERMFWLLAGWCIRPGFGDPGDPLRVAALAPLFDERLASPGEARGWQQFWIAWRRAAAGLDEAVQTRIRDFVDDYLAPPGAGHKRPKKPALALDDALDMASSLERVAPSRRVELGGWVLERTWVSRDARLWTAIGRIGARVPAYASAHHVVAPLVAERWLDHLLREKWDAVPTAAQAAVRLARRTGDRARDVNDVVRRDVERRLLAVHADEDWVRAVREVVAVDEKERTAFFGDSLPLGLRLVDDAPHLQTP